MVLCKRTHSADGDIVFVQGKYYQYDCVHELHEKLIGIVDENGNKHDFWAPWGSEIFYTIDEVRDMQIDIILNM